MRAVGNHDQREVDCLECRSHACDRLGRGGDQLLDLVVQGFLELIRERDAKAPLDEA